MLMLTDTCLDHLRSFLKTVEYWAFPSGPKIRGREREREMYVQDVYIMMYTMCQLLIKS